MILMELTASKTWKKLGRQHDAILRQKNGWDTFRRTIASRYFTDPDFTVEDIHTVYNLLKEKGVSLNETDYLEGGPVYALIDGKIVTQDLLTSASELHSMEKVIDFSKVRKFVEIGGGYGRMALLLLQRYPDILYTIVDVHPAIDVSRKYLEGKCKVRLLEPQDLSSVGDVDVFYSSSVMSELDSGKVRYYFDYINNHARFFYLKDWTKGHHMNNMPALAWIWLSLVNRASLWATGNYSEWALRKKEAYRFNEATWRRFSHEWKELLHQHCMNETSYSPSKKPNSSPRFFEIIYQISI